MLRPCSRASLEVPPPFVTAVGVSSVSDKYMMTLWSEIISVEPDTHDGKGKGYMVHPMWFRFHGGWNVVREQSCIFGWECFVAFDQKNVTTANARWSILKRERKFWLMISIS